ncbi:MAG: hypothetical protein Q8L79_03205 [Methylobacter sp.]|uniref:hypothetical protein n=1 Tax=Methylobacter sp. TaxID=2051955 RepID=UPI0027321EF0|nr:hypothetical protein [Methylobacter sp.]MDP1664109.1 hypothetical protein [Methylobacter sp.]
MSKKRFVQTVVARSLPPPDKRQACLDYALDLYDWLTGKGYGDDKPSQPRDGKDWYTKLDERQRRWFDGFWVMFDYKKDRDGAAMRWSQLGKLSDAEYQQIIDAAKSEAKRELPQGQARKMAQGWLHEKRYLDFTPTKTAAKSMQNHVLTRLLNDLNGVKRLYETSKDEALLPQIGKLEAAVKTARDNPETNRKPQ